MSLADKLGVEVGLENLIRYTMKVHISEIKNANDEVIMTRLSFYDDVLIELNNRTDEFNIIGDNESIKYFKKLVNNIEGGNE